MNDHLKNTLQDLHNHLASTASVDDELKALLQTLDRDIQQLLNQPAPPADDAPLSTRAQELSAQFAAQHPKLETLLRELSNTLERMGI